MSRNLVVLVGLGAVLLGGGSAARATSVERFDLAELTSRSEVVVHGRCTKTTSRTDAKGTIVTDVELEVTEPLKGAAAAKTFSFTVYGGIVGNRGSTICGAPTFAEGEEQLLFLSAENGAKLRTCIGLSQGKYTIRTEGDRKLAYRNLEGLTLVDRTTGEALEPAKPDQGVPLDELVGRIRAHVGK